MEITVIKELQDYEKSQEEVLGQKKQTTIVKFEDEKKALLEKNKKEIEDLLKGKGALVKKAQTKAKKQAEDTITSFKKKTTELQQSSSGKIDDAVEVIFDDFKNV